MSTGGSLRILTDWDDGEYSRLCDELAVHFDQRRVCPLLGAGISVASPANISPAAPLVNGLIDVFEYALNIAQDLTNLSESDVRPARRLLRAARLEKLLDALHQTHGRLALDYISCLHGAHWNVNHATLAALSAATSLPVAITLNFDLLIEYAIAALGCSCQTWCPLMSQRFVTGSGPTHTLLLKPHGSFTPPHVGPDLYQHLSATLSQAGTRPASRNIQAVAQAFATSPVLLVAGYSNDDWDIFPIVQHLAGRLSAVVWVDYAPTREAAQQKRLEFESGSSTGGIATRVVPWLRALGRRSTLLIGRVDELLTKIVRTQKISCLFSDGANKPNAPDARVFAISGLPLNETSLRTLLALAQLVRHIAPIGEQLLNRLSRLPELKNNRTLLPHLYLNMAHAEHTRGRIRPAIRYMQGRIGCRARTDDTSDNTLWIGYEYLCLAKRPERSSRGHASRSSKLLFSTTVVGWLLMLPINVLRGRWFLAHAVTRSTSGRPLLRAQAQYYWADLLHCWGNLLMLAGPRIVPILRPYFSIVEHRYSRIAKASPEGQELMANDYYWLRHLEAQLLAGRPLGWRSEVHGKLDEIEHRNRLVQDDVQAGNTHAYRALIAFLCDDDPGLAAQHLDRARVAWAQSGGSMASGQRRVALFSRFIGQIGLRDTLQKMFGG